MDITRRTILGASAASFGFTGVLGTTAASMSVTNVTAATTPVTRVTEPFKVAAVQAESAYLDLKRGIEKTVSYIEQAAVGGAKLVAFPELWLPGYPFGHESQEWKKAYLKQYIANSLIVGSDEWQTLQDAAARHRIFVSLGYSEVDGDHLYMGQALLGPAGKPVQVRRKLRPSGGERTIWSDSDASGLKVYDTELGRIGSLSCWEHMHPQMTYLMQAQMEHIHIGAWPILPDVDGVGWASPTVNLAAARYYTTLTGAVSVVPCAVVGEDMYNKFQAIEASQWVPRGGGHARIYGGFGLELAQPIAHTDEGLVMATVDPATFSAKKEDPNGEFSFGVLQFITDHYPAARVPDKEHGSKNMVSIRSLL